MKMGDSNGAIVEAIGILRKMWISRKIQIRIKDKTLIDIDYTIPGLIDDTINAIWDPGNTGKKIKPLIIKTNKKESGTGWDFVIHLPPGISYRDFAAKLHYFGDATGGAVEIKKQGKAAILTVLTDELHRSYAYNWHETDLSRFVDTKNKIKKHLPFPIGHSAAGFIEDDLAEYPNLLIAGHPGAGKSNMLHVILLSLLILPRDNRQVWPIIIDLKRVEYGYLSNHAMLIENIPESKMILQAINKELDKRAGYLKKYKTVRNHDLKQPMPWIVLVIDELAELQDKECQELLNRIVRLGRAPGICVVAATQRPSSTMFQAWGDSKAMFPATICFKVRDDVNSRMVIGNDRAAIIPEIPGRAIYQWERELEVQVPFLPIKKARKILREFVSPGYGPESPNQNKNHNGKGVTLYGNQLLKQLAPKRLPPRQGHHRGSDETQMLKHGSNLPPIF